MVKHRRGKKKGGGLWKTLKRAVGIKSRNARNTQKNYLKLANNSNNSNNTKKSIFEHPNVKGKVNKGTKKMSSALKVFGTKPRNSSNRNSSRSLSNSSNTSSRSSSASLSNSLKKINAPKSPSINSNKMLTIMNEESIRNSYDIPVTKLELSNGSTILINEIESIEIVGFDIKEGTIDINIAKTIVNTQNLRKEKHIKGIRIKNDILLEKMKDILNKELEEIVQIRDKKYPKSKDISGQYTKERLEELKDKFKNAVELKN